MASEQTNEKIDLVEYEEIIPQYENKFYFGLDDNKQIVSWHISFSSEEESRFCECVEVSKEMFEIAESHHRLVDGVLVDGVQPKFVMDEEQAKMHKAQLLKLIPAEVSNIQLKFMAGRSLSEDEKSFIESWVAYVQALEDCDPMNVDSLQRPTFKE